MANEQNNPQRDQQQQNNPQGGQNKPGQQQQGAARTSRANSRASRTSPANSRASRQARQGGQHGGAEPLTITVQGGSPREGGLPLFCVKRVSRFRRAASSSARSAYACGMASTLPLFHLYGDPPDDQAFDFIHVETIASRSSIHDWTIRAHRHRNLFQILLIERGGGEMTFEAATLPFAAPAAILVPATIAHGFRFEPNVTDGWVVSFTEDAAGPLADRAGEALARLRALAAHPIVPIADDTERGAALGAVRGTLSRSTASRAKVIGWRCAACSC